MQHDETHDFDHGVEAHRVVNHFPVSWRDNSLLHSSDALEVNCRRSRQLIEEPY